MMLLFLENLKFTRYLYYFYFNYFFHFFKITTFTIEFSESLYYNGILKDYIQFVKKLR